MTLNNRHDIQSVIMNKTPQIRPRYSRHDKQQLFTELCLAQFTPEYKEILKRVKDNLQKTD